MIYKVLLSSSDILYLSPSPHRGAVSSCSQLTPSKAPLLLPQWSLEAASIIQLITQCRPMFDLLSHSSCREEKRKVVEDDGLRGDLVHTRGKARGKAAGERPLATVNVSRYYFPLLGWPAIIFSWWLTNYSNRLPGNVKEKTPVPQWSI